MSERGELVSPRRIRLLDAAMGTRLIAAGLELGKRDASQWCLERPEAVAAVHRADAAAGAEVVFTNTFGANRDWLGRFGAAGDVERICRAAVRIAREAAPGCEVFGSIGPTGGTDRALREQADALIEAGVDALVLETWGVGVDRAVAAVREGTNARVLVSLVAIPENDEEARALVGRIEEAGAEAVGANCQRTPAETLALVGRLAGLTRMPLLAKPGGGVPGEELLGPEAWAEVGLAIAGIEGVGWMGGCCGTTDEHLRAIAGKKDSH